MFSHALQRKPDLGATMAINLGGRFHGTMQMRLPITSGQAACARAAGQTTLALQGASLVSALHAAAPAQQ